MPSQSVEACETLFHNAMCKGDPACQHHGTFTMRELVKEQPDVVVLFEVRTMQSAMEKLVLNSDNFGDDVQCTTVPHPGFILRGPNITSHRKSITRYDNSVLL